MAGVVKTLLIGASIMVIVMFGGFSFMNNAYNAYGISSNSTALNVTRQYLNTVNQTTSDYQSFVSEDGSVKLDVLSLLGLVFTKLGEFVKGIFSIGVLVIQVLTGLQSSNPLFVIPDEFITLIGGIVTISLIIAGIALLISRSSEDI